MYQENFGSVKGGKRRRLRKQTDCMRKEDSKQLCSGSAEFETFVDATPNGELAAQWKKAL